MKYPSYTQNIIVWTRLYNVTVLPLIHYPPCVRCGKKSVNRHHKAHDYLFACILSDTYAKRYLEFHPDDIDFLCRKCHVNCHRIYDELIEALNAELSLHKGKNYNLDKIREVCNTYKQLFLERYLKWKNWGKKK